MFTGIVTTGKVLQVSEENDCKHFCIRPNAPLTHCRVGDSISVNGVCLTITYLESGTFFASAVPETLRLTNLSLLSSGTEVNLEPALTPTTPMGGHYVQGHVDITSKILSIEKDGASAWLVKFATPATLARYIVNKGFIAIDGMSITVIEANAAWFSVTFIPHTIEHTIVKNYQVNHSINIEVDLLAKYLEKLRSV